MCYLNGEGVLGVTVAVFVSAMKNQFVPFKFLLIRLPSSSSCKINFSMYCTDGMIRITYALTPGESPREKYIKILELSTRSGVLKT